MNKTWIPILIYHLSLKYLRVFGRRKKEIQWNTFFDTACKNGRLPFIKYLVERKANACNVNAKNDEALRLVSGNGHFEVVKYLVEHKANVHARDNASLRKASKNGHFNVVQYLVENKANVHAMDDYALRWASWNGHINVVQYLVQHKANVNVVLMKRYDG